MRTFCHETKVRIDRADVFMGKTKIRSFTFFRRPCRKSQGKIESYEMGSDYSEIRELARPKLYELERQFSENRMVLERNLQEEQENLYQAETELEEWKKSKGS
mgnify:CR=1 FL=1